MSQSDNLSSKYDMTTWLRCCEEEVKEPLEGKIKGEIPSWLTGTLIRNGPGTVRIGSMEYEHVFDGSSYLHSFAINKGKVTYQGRFLNSEAYKKNKKANRIVITEFGTKSVPDPCHTIFDRISLFFDPLSYITDNAGVSIHPFGDQVYAMTEVPTVFKINKTSLETMERKTLLYSLIVCHTAHPHVMPNGDVFNVGVQLVKGFLKHVIVKFPYSAKEDMFDTAEVVSVIEPRWSFSPTYSHSFGITDNYFIIIEQPLIISTFGLMKNAVINQPFSSALRWYPEYETQILLINRNTGAKTRYRTDTFFFMHVINSFESDGQVTVDVCSYDDAKIIDAMYVDAIKNADINPDYGQWCKSRPKRFEIPLDAAPFTKVEPRLLADIGIEAPRINYDSYNGRPYRYFYGIGSEITAKVAGSIIKIDAVTGEVKTWREHDGYPSEAVFIARPGAKDEDDGVLLSAVIWGKMDNAVTLLVLDARDLREIARADFSTPSQMPKCFHGWFFPDKMTIK
ncbi:carotenoid isomerooxygenase-like [Vanessa cardui]|uniref:carotenoid isomerooxygenase-like n=1 Tax=Vanessa cardui TaxID=171605 RepID=UPI001F12A297|nr:carotenoid isomerooxygenase-like [Vanessa cardui]